MEQEPEKVFDSVYEIINAGDISHELKKLKELQILLSEQKATSAFFNSPNSLIQFIEYLFDRRFGWSDERVQSPLKSKKQPHSFEDESRIKKALNETADEFFFFLKQQPITSLLLIALSHVIENAENKPVVREQTFKHFFDWMNHQIASDNTIKEKVSQNFSYIEVQYSYVKQILANCCCWID